MEKRSTVVAAFLGIFVAGGVTGALLTLRFAPQHTITTFVATTPSASNTTASGNQTAVPTTAATPSTATATANTVAAVPPPHPAPEQLGPQLFRRITNQLNLTPQQRQKIRPIELHATEQLNRLRRDTVHETQVLIDKNEDEIREVLTPEQAARFDVLVAQQRERIEKFVADQQRRQREQREKFLQGRAGVTPGAQVKSPAQGGNASLVPVGGEEKKED